MKTIKLIPEQMELLKSIREDEKAAELGFRHACQYLKIIHDRLSQQLKKLFPDLKVISINWENETLDIEDNE